MPYIPDSITCHGDRFRMYIPPEKIAEKVAEIGEQISRDLEGTRPIMIGVVALWVLSMFAAKQRA